MLVVVKSLNDSLKFNLISDHMWHVRADCLQVPNLQVLLCRFLRRMHTSQITVKLASAWTTTIVYDKSLQNIPEISHLIGINVQSQLSSDTAAILTAGYDPDFHCQYMYMTTCCNMDWYAMPFWTAELLERLTMVCNANYYWKCSMLDTQARKWFIFLLSLKTLTDNHC